MIEGINPLSPFAKGLRAWWLVHPSNDGGRIFYDMVGHQHLTLSGGAVFGDNAHHGLFGSITLPGTAAYGVSAQTSAQLVLGNDGTVSMWVRATDAASASHVPASGYGSATSDGWLFNQFAFSIWLYWKSPSPSVQANDTLLANTWHFIACTNVAGSLTMYVDGVQRATGTSGGAITVSPKVTIGATQTPSLPFIGNVDDLQIRDYGMSAQQVADLFNESRERYPTLLSRQPEAEVLSGGQFVGPDISMHPLTSLIC